MFFRSALALLALGAAAGQNLPTRGRTDGEPGTGEHCCGMKGLGGATVTVLCHPDTIALGKDFTVNVAYTTDIKRPVDVHVDVLNAQNKQVRPTTAGHSQGSGGRELGLVVGARVWGPGRSGSWVLKPTTIRLRLEGVERKRLTD